MSKKYDIGKYNRGRYSRMTPAEAEAVVAATTVVVSSGSIIATTDAIVAGNFTLSSAANALFGGSGGVLGLFDAYAEGVVVGIQQGEALIEGEFSLYATASGTFVGEVLIAAAFGLVVEEYAGPYWNPENSGQPWNPIMGGSDIWVKQAEPLSPWSN